MSVYYPQGAIILDVLFEDYGKFDNEKLQQVSQLKILARNLKVEINDYKEADTFTADIDYKSFPFDPRNIRACKISIFMEDRKSIFKGTGNDLNLLEFSEDNVVFVGYVDEQNLKFNETSRTVSMEGRDLTSLFTDAKYLGGPVATTKPIDQIIQELISKQEATKTIEVINETGETLPVLSKLAPNLDSTSGMVNPKKKTSFWDMIVEIADKAGLVVFMRLDKLVITKPRNLYKKQSVKNFIYGKNLKDLSFKRKLGKHKGFNVKVRSINLQKKQLLEASIPKDSSRSDLGGGVEITIPQLDKNGKKIEPAKPAPYLTFNVSDIVSKEKLIEVGESIFEELSRQQLEGNLSTKEMLVPETPYKKEEDGSYTPYSEEYSNPVKFSTIKNGTPIKIFLDIEDMEYIRTLSNINERKKYLILQGFESKVAEAMAESMNRASYVFYTKSVTFTINQDTGFGMDLEFINFIELDNKNLGV